MNRIANTSTNRAGLINESNGKNLSSAADALNGLPFETSLDAISRAQLSTEQQAHSFRAAPVATPSPVASLTNFLGPLMTAANPVWGHNAVPKMRQLQKRLIEHSLTLHEGDRSGCMQAIMEVDNSVKLRLRFEQMRMSMPEMEASPAVVEAA